MTQLELMIGFLTKYKYLPNTRRQFPLVYGISTIVGYSYQIHFYTYKQFSFKQFSLA